MRILNVSPKSLKSNSSANKAFGAHKNISSPKLLNQADTVTFGRRRDDEEGEEAPERPRRKRRGAGRIFFKGAVGIVAALGLASAGVQGYNAGSAILAQKELSDAFKNNPKNVAVAFAETFASGDNGFGSGDMHFEYTENATVNPFIIKNQNDSMLGPDSIVALDFADGVFSSASLDIDGDKHPEITVTTDEGGNLVISYDYDSDGKIDTVETLAKEGEE